MPITQSNKTHPRYNRERAAWYCMNQRCNDPNAANYYLYGGRGISVCERWKSLANFLDDMGKCPSGCSLGRVNNDKPYGPDNCEWQTPKQQANNRRGNVHLTFNGKTLTLSQWADELGTSLTNIRWRIRQRPEWPIEDILSPPNLGRKRHKYFTRQ